MTSDTQRTAAMGPPSDPPDSTPIRATGRHGGHDYSTGGDLAPGNQRTATVDPPSAPADSASIRQRLVAGVGALTALDRRTGSVGERQSAQWIAGQLREIGAADIEISMFRTQTSWAQVHLAYTAAALALGTRSGAAARVANAGVALSYELEVSGRTQWLRRFLPARHGVSVSARIAAAGVPRRTLVLVAHHDAAHNGMVWHPRTVAANRVRSARTGRAVPSHAVVLGAMAATAVPARGIRRAARALLIVAGGAMIQSMRTYTTPGANDNATGVVAVLELARRLRAAPFPDTDVVVLFPGGEEAGNLGMVAWMKQARAALEPEKTLVVNLDSLGSGGHLVVARREGLTGRFAARDVAAARKAAAHAGIELRAVTFPNVCDTSIARHAGMRAISLLSYADGWISNLHLRSDTVENVAWETVEDAITLTERLAAGWNDGSIDDD
ncbi:M28 family metallopeptidase [Nocardia sp. NPDC057668]|uniref:M28 family metallopeptidase n=1 Tax=Nocardia sp. NPDC057668 TaxID=3346202 RepID=UPI00366DC684